MEQLFENLNLNSDIIVIDESERDHDNNNEHENYFDLTKFISDIVNDYQHNILLKLYTDIDNKMYIVNYNEIDYNIIIEILGSKKSNKREHYFITFNKLNGKFICNCKDFMFRSHTKNIVCKHICFLLCKVSNIYDLDYFNSKSKELSLNNSKIFVKKLTDNDLWNNTNISIKNINNEFNPNNSKKKFNPIDSCPICYECFNDKSLVLSCSQCHNFIHIECLNVWFETKKTCVLCRLPWLNYIKNIDNI